MELGYKISSEEHGPRRLVEHARMAENAGFTFLAISDHYHPWIDAQGHSPFVWNVIGAIGQATSTIRIGTAVTCPTMRIHPAIIAQAAATSQVMLEGRFFLGVGTGENLNEHILADYWPSTPVRQEMLEEAVEVMRTLWGGGLQSHRGEHYVVENARIYDLPEQPVPVYVAASGKKSVRLAARVGDGLVCVAPDRGLIETFDEAGGSGPKYGEVFCCYARDEDEGKKIAHEWWPNIAVPGKLTAELALPSYFEAASGQVEPDDLTDTIACGRDPEKYVDNIRKFSDAGFDHLFIHNVGPNQDEFFNFFPKEVMPKVG